MAWLLRVPIHYFLALALGLWVVSVNIFGVESGDDAANLSASANGKLPAIRPEVAPLPKEARELPDFRAVPAGTQRKEAFFEYLVPIIHHINSQILLERYQLKGIVETLKNNKLLSSKQQRQLVSLLKKYRIEETELPQQIQRLQLRVDVVPASLAIAQAANESAWGTSRFAVEANNLFGQWCYRVGCGLVPSQRHDDDIHEVRAFQTPVESVASYMRNLNTHDAYTDLRKLRRKVRVSNEGVTGLHIVQGLEQYSSRGQDYVDELSAMIRFNDLQQYDEY